ncbi:unnamed protein product [Linum trigynum]|uniref:Uncharacterized protein n=2 Tax=Linum trigynum TaxID=586398 RepID=A0AAV2G6V5_9ROSI
MISLRAVSKLGFPIRKHPSPYSTSLLKIGSSVFVTEEVILPFRIGSYEDEVRCDVVPLKMTHVVLGDPWHVDCGARRSRSTKHIRMRHCGKLFALKLLSPEEAAQDRATLLQQLRDEEDRAEAVATSIGEPSLKALEFQFVEEEHSNKEESLCSSTDAQGRRESETGRAIGSRGMKLIASIHSIMWQKRAA